MTVQPAFPPISSVTASTRDFARARFLIEDVYPSIEQGRYFGLDDIGSDIWRRIEPPCSFAELIDRLVADYDADRATITADVQSLLGRMVEQDVVRFT